MQEIVNDGEKFSNEFRSSCLLPLHGLLLGFEVDTVR